MSLKIIQESIELTDGDSDFTAESDRGQSAVGDHRPDVSWGCRESRCDVNTGQEALGWFWLNMGAVHVYSCSGGQLRQDSAPIACCSGATIVQSTTAQLELARHQWVLVSPLDCMDMYSNSSTWYLIQRY